MSSIVISFINLKGGVGKTSSAINIGYKLSEKDKVLIIDMDPQFNATQSLLNHQYAYHSEVIPNEIVSKVKEEFNEFKNDDNELNKSEKDKSENNDNSNEENMIKSQMVYQKLKDEKRTAKSLFSNDSLVNELNKPDLTYKIKDNLYLIPGDLDLFKTLNGDTAGKHNTLHDHLDKFNLRDEYKYILIDCPPNWTILTQTSLFASDYYIIPSKLDLFSSVGIILLQDLVFNTFLHEGLPMYSTYCLFREKIGRKKLAPLGILFTLTHDMNISEKVKTDLKNEIQYIDFFDSEIPYHKTVPMKFSMYAEIDGRYRSLKNAIEKVVEEMYTKIKEKEGELDE